ncbi:hypothetical protein VNO78_30423 [Psophocarpus tetragonolobus]|uniref:Uncharacterized protein n=1 Tax=Psophocarpus tetragonolobus TaxID=3891 RepID=A0AAN9RWQ9_PSOTE
MSRQRWGSRRERCCRASGKGGPSGSWRASHKQWRRRRLYIPSTTLHHVTNHSGGIIVLLCPILLGLRNLNGYCCEKEKMGIVVKKER